MGRMFTDARVTGLSPIEAAKDLMRKMGYTNYRLEEVNNIIFANIEVLCRSGIKYYMVLDNVPCESYMYS